MTGTRSHILATGIAALFLAFADGHCQSPCPTQVLNPSATKSSALICLIPQVYGAGGLVGIDNGGPLAVTTGHSVHFQASTVRSFGPINSEIGSELSQLPLATPVSGFIFSGGVITPSSTFGPIITDRAETIGKSKLFLGATYQYFNFDKADGVNLKSFGAVFTHELEPLVCILDPNDPANPCVNGEPLYQQDIVATVNRIDLKVHQVTFVGTFGITDKVDVSIAVPVLGIHMAIASAAQIFSFEPPPLEHMFDLANGTTSSMESFSNPGSSSGVGDITFRGKYLAKQTERAAVAVGADIRLHTGDPQNFTGSGTWGFHPFVTYTGRTGKISPHGTVGFQANGQSLLGGDITAATPLKGHLPDFVGYSAGVDGSIGHKLGYAFDFIGQSILHGSAIRTSTFTDYLGGKHSDVTSYTATINELSASAGVKVPIGANLLLTANGLFRLNDAGLHSKPSPLLGISYVF